MVESCEICSGKADDLFKRVEIWSNERWRLTMTTYRALRGFCYLEPKKHIPHITDLKGTEASEFGTVLSTVSNAIKNASGAKLVYAYIYGDHIPHLHVHLAPHSDGDFYVDDVIKSGVQIDESDFLDARELDLLSSTIKEKISITD
jgi:diadenosine tetraphosphate (Ap4A) HIT family hydrolase